MAACGAISTTGNQGTWRARSSSPTRAAAASQRGGSARIPSIWMRSPSSGPTSPRSSRISPRHQTATARLRPKKVRRPGVTRSRCQTPSAIHAASSSTSSSSREWSHIRMLLPAARIDRPGARREARRALGCKFSPVRLGRSLPAQRTRASHLFTGGAPSTMRAVPTRTLVIVNPFSRDGATGRRFAAVERRLREVLGPLEVERTRGPRDAERLAREAVRAGVERLIVAGGDGTLSEVATGLLGAGLGDYARIGILPFGTGGDFVRTLGVPRDLERAIACIAEGKVRRVDAYRVTLQDDAGRPRTVYGVNITSIGISALVVMLAERAPGFVGGGAFALGALRAIARWRSEPVRITLDGETLHDGPLILATAANGRWFGGGMLVSPKAWCDDGRLDAFAVGGLSKAQLLVKLAQIYRGTHLADGASRIGRGRVFEALGPPSVRVEVDGESLGSLPLRVEILEGALSLFAPAP